MNIKITMSWEEWQRVKMALLDKQCRESEIAIGLGLRESAPAKIYSSIHDRIDFQMRESANQKEPQ